METQRIEGSTVGVVGGSLSGCAAAIALSRLGSDVTVFERSTGILHDRGAGIVIPHALREELQAAEYLPADYPSCSLVGRAFVVADGTPFGDVRWVQPGSASSNNWGVLWHALRSALAPSVDYRNGIIATDARAEDHSVLLEFAGGGEQRFDAVVGADGYRSLIRSVIEPDAAPRYAGYVAWRGNFAADRLSDTAVWEDMLATKRWITVGFDGGHALVYPIPDFGSDGDRLRVNWVMYAETPRGLAVTEPSSIAPGHVDHHAYAQYEELLQRWIPARLQPLFTSPIDEISIQPIYDQSVHSYVRGRIALIGDAATVARPHTASGSTKALEDARLLEIVGAQRHTWDSLFAEYGEIRTRAGRAVVELGRRIGRDQVERTPAWAEMTPDDYRAWTRNTLDAANLYFWDDE